jgi:hypothetical protein
MEDVVVKKSTRASKCKICGELTKEYVIYKNLKYHMNCYDIKLNNESENKEWIELYEYVRKEIMQYTSIMSLNRFMVLRLKGLKDGNFVISSKLDKNAKYSYKSILYTFMAKKIEILNMIGDKTFQDEMHKFNTIMVIIEKNLNDTVLRLERVKQSESKINNLDLDDFSYNVNTDTKHDDKKDIIDTTQQNKTENKVAKTLKDIW